MYIDNLKFGEKPHVEYYKKINTDMVRIPYDLTEISPGIYSWRELSVRYTALNYGDIVSALIDLKYSPATMTAIINNYLLDTDDIEAKAEFEEMQNYRKEAKLKAKAIIAELNL